MYLHIILKTCYLGHWSNAKCSMCSRSNIIKWTDDIYGSYKDSCLTSMKLCKLSIPGSPRVVYVTRNLSKYINIKNPPLTSSFSSAPFVIVRIAVRLHWGKWREAGNAGKDGTPMPTAGRVLYNMVITWNLHKSQLPTYNHQGLNSHVKTLLARDVVYYIDTIQVIVKLHLSAKVALGNNSN